VHGWHHTGDIDTWTRTFSLHRRSRKDMIITGGSTSIPSKLRMPCRPTKPFRIVPSSFAGDKWASALCCGAAESRTHRRYRRGIAFVKQRVGSVKTPSRLSLG